MGLASVYPSPKRADSKSMHAFDALLKMCFTVVPMVLLV